MTMPAFHLAHATRQYRNKIALHPLTLSQEAGHILGIVGLAGSGKTTLIHLIAGLDKPTAGLISVLGGSPQQASIRTQIGIALKPQLLDPRLTCETTLVQFSRLKGFSPKASRQISEQLLDELKLQTEGSTLVADLSDSSRRLLGASAALIGGSKILLFDGTLDSLSASDLSLLASILRNRRTLGNTVVIASCNAAALDELCDDIALLHCGTLIGKGTPQEIASSLRGLLFKYQVDGNQCAVLDWETVATRYTGTCTEVLASHDITEQLALHMDRDAIVEITPTLEEACEWILRNPEAIAARSKLWEQDTASQSTTG